MGERVRQTLQSAGVRTVTAPDARMVQVPASTMVTVVPETVHLVVVWIAKLTVRPELAVAATEKVGWAAKVNGPTAGKSMV